MGFRHDVDSKGLINQRCSFGFADVSETLGDGDERAESGTGRELAELGSSGRASAGPSSGGYQEPAQWGGGSELRWLLDGRSANFELPWGCSGGPERGREFIEDDAGTRSDSRTY